MPLSPSRRHALLLGAGALLSSRPARAALPPPAFTAWVGRIARLRAPLGAARLLLEPDGTGSVEVRALFICRAAPVTAWRITADGLRLDYRRRSFLDPSREVPGQARIEAGSGILHWQEARDELAEFEGFEPREAPGRC